MNGYYIVGIRHYSRQRLVLHDSGEDVTVGLAFKTTPHPDFGSWTHIETTQNTIL